MLDPAYIRDHVDDVRRALRNRGLDPDKALEDIATLETARRRLIPELEGLKRQQNTSGDEIARAKRQGKRLGRPTVIVDREKIRQCAAAGHSIKSLAKEWQIARATVRDILGRSRVAKNPTKSGAVSC